MTNPPNYLWFAPSSHYEGGQPITIDKVLNDVAHAFKVTKEEMIGKSRKREISDARHVAQYLIKDKMNRTNSATGAIFNRAHCTVIHAVKNVQFLMETDTNIKRLVQGIIVKNDFFRSYER
tara:strand:+ start:263 stop:625 length:363 start_codon:yes stop_codon:yes gene_type:complete